jgi:hypothetical protein
VRGMLIIRERESRQDEHQRVVPPDTPNQGDVQDANQQVRPALSACEEAKCECQQQGFGGGAYVTYGLLDVEPTFCAFRSVKRTMLEAAGRGTLLGRG